MAAALRAKKSLGQHFLRDRGVLEKILHAADLSPDDRVLEIGAGDATLTAPLSRACGRLIALETDHRRVPRLRETVPRRRERRDRRRRHPAVRPGDPRAVRAPLKCVSNLPYNIATAVLERLLARRGMFSLLVLMFQKEVGRRLVAGPGDAAYGSLSLATQYRAEASLVCTVPRRAFSPPPAVESAVVRLVPRTGAAAAAGPGADVRSPAARRFRLPAQDLPQLRRDLRRGRSRRKRWRPASRRSA